MLTSQQISEIREHLERAQNPLFFYDNDADGLCSFLLLRRFIGRGKGVAIKSYPSLHTQYVRRIHELNADYIFILDKPLVSEEFLKEVHELQIPVVWIDHHEAPVQEVLALFPEVSYYNPVINTGKDKSNEPVTYLSYMISNNKEDQWIAMMGCIADHFLPDFSEEFGKTYPELWKKGISEPFDAYYRTEIGKIAQALGFGIKDSISHVVALQSYLLSCKSPHDVLGESDFNIQFREKNAELRKKYDVLIEQAKQCVQGNLLFFTYGGTLSISSELSNELSYLFPGIYITVVYLKGNELKISMRGKNVKSLLERILPAFPGATGGGHDDAVGSVIKADQLSTFQNLLLEEIKK